jgi:hypothetical protein
VQFGDTATTQLTLYVFRPTLWDVPVWFDRVETQILKRDLYGVAVPSGEPIVFVPPKSATASALRRVYIPSKLPFRSTAAAMVPLPQWLLAMRVSSVTLDAAGLDAKLVEAIDGLGWPAPASGAAAATAAAPVRPCDAPLSFSKKAKLKKPDMGMAILGALLASVPEHGDSEEAPEAAAGGFCREGAATVDLASYRSLGGGTGYVIAIGDAGRTIDVQPELPLDGKRPGYAVTFNDLAISRVYPAFDKLPFPAAVLDMMRRTNPISSTSRKGDDISVSVEQ